MSGLLAEVMHNQIATGLGATAIMGGILYQARQIPAVLKSAFLRFYTVSLTADSRSDAFGWLDKWLSEQSYASRANMLNLKDHSDISRAADNHSDVRAQKYLLTPGYGHHWFWWKHRLVYVERELNANQKTERPYELLKFRTMGKSHRILREMVEEAYAFTSRETMVKIYAWSDGWWQLSGNRLPRSKNSVVLRSGQMDRMLLDIEHFIDARTWYSERGIPYRRCYLFYGVPGTGKTSAVLAIASHISRPVCILNLGSMNGDSELLGALASAQKDALVLMEDIDRVPMAQSGGDGKISMSVMLNAIDGIATHDGRIFIMTTNHPEKLDAALIRPGRVDVREEFHVLSKDGQSEMMRRFYGENVIFEPLEFDVSPAEMQAACAMHHDNPEAAIRQLKHR